MAYQIVTIKTVKMEVSDLGSYKNVNLKDSCNTRNCGS